MTTTVNTTHITAHLKGCASTRLAIIRAMQPEIFPSHIFNNMVEWIEAGEDVFTNAHNELANIACNIDDMEHYPAYHQVDIDRAKESYAYLESVVSYATNELYNVHEGEDKYV